MLVQSIWPHSEHEIICSEVKKRFIKNVNVDARSMTKTAIIYNIIINPHADVYVLILLHVNCVFLRAKFGIQNHASVFVQFTPSSHAQLVTFLITPLHAHVFLLVLKPLKEWWQHW